jgi:hypothetical protein
MNEIVAEMVQQVRLLDGLVRYRCGDNAELMEAWLSGSVTATRTPGFGSAPLRQATPATSSRLRRQGVGARLPRR